MTTGGTTPRTGTVTAFDPHAGLGWIVDDDGPTHRFHAVQIADGSRGVEVGQAVAFVRLARLGAFEAAGIRNI